ncbi:acrosin-like [Spea bombifrons]|uniref:acrosin-like n=1 Tax=Spea bombifrons TaxID=233779 RepID=UPI00234B1252|nr:acrosin-like [Spea bombifrons]
MKQLYLIFLFVRVLFSASESSDHAVCGNRPLVVDFRGSRVVGGKNSEPGNWPWMVSIQEHSEDGEYYWWRLVFGANQLSNKEINTQIQTIQEKFEHEKYYPELEQNDIALLRLNQPIVFDEYTQPACLPAEQAVLSKMADCYVAGWGAPDETSIKPSDILHGVPVNFIPVEGCNKPNWYNGAVGNYNLCAGYEQGTFDTCQGDSGGPLMCKRRKANFYTVVGITSWGSGCGQKQRPGVYTSTQYYLKWIFEHISDNTKPKSKNYKK